MASRRCTLMLMLLSIVCARVTHSAIVSPSAAVAFEDDVEGCSEIALQQDVLGELLARDGSCAPRQEGCVVADYLATGRSAGYLDALSLGFNVSEFSPAQLQGMKLRMYVRRGGYSDPQWHAIRLYAGAFNPADEDCDNAMACWTSSDEFPGTVAWEGWIERQVPAAWLGPDGLRLTLRVWNASIDAVELDVADAAPPALPALVQATGFEDDYEGCGTGPLRIDVTELVGARDGRFAPQMGGCVVAGYFATGTSAGYLDALSVRFDTSQLPPAQVQPEVLLRAYVRLGTYRDLTWHALRVYQGGFNVADEDCDSPGVCWGPADEFPGAPGWEGWIERYVPGAWVQNGRLDVTLRVWNASIDAIELGTNAPTSVHPTTWGRLKVGSSRR